jgi:ribonuclease P protein component
LPAGARKAARDSRLKGIGLALLRAPAGFSTRQRLHRPAEFGRVFAENTRSTDRFFTILARPNGEPLARLGLTISRRAAKHAVDRNKLKRLAREAFRHQPSLPPCDFVVLAKPGAHSAEARLLRESLDRHFDRLKKAAIAGRNG